MANSESSPMQHKPLRNTRCIEKPVFSPALLSAPRSLLLALGALLFALCSITEAQQIPGNIPRIGYLAGSGEPKAPGPQIEAFNKDCVSLVISKEEMFTSTIGTFRTSRTGFLSWLQNC